MLSDFLLLETYYDAPQTVRSYEDLVRQYGRKTLSAAIKANYIMCKPLKCGSKKGEEILFWLSDHGRRAAATNSAAL